MSQRVYSLDNFTCLIDGFDLSTAKRTGSYVLLDSDRNCFSLIETGPSLSVPHLKKGIKELNLSLDNLENIIVTHIHLDHAGGVGLLLRDCPSAKVIVHPKGARHLVDPSKLVAGAKAVYGKKFDSLFNPVIPVPKHNIQEIEDHQQITISKDRILTFLDTPGHANHHISILDTKTGTIFTGDTIGVRYADLDEEGVNFFLPSTSPNQFNPDAMKDSLNTILSYKPKRIAFGHFGISSAPQVVAEQLTYWLDIFTREGKSHYEQGKNHEELADTLLVFVTEYLKKESIPSTHPIFEMIRLDLFISAMGIIDYFNKQSAK